MTRTAIVNTVTRRHTRVNWGLLLHLHHVVSDRHLSLLLIGVHHHLSRLLTHHLLLLRNHLSDDLTSLHLHLLLIGRSHWHTKTLSNWSHKPLLHLHLLTRTRHRWPHNRLW